MLQYLGFLFLLSSIIYLTSLLPFCAPSFFKNGGVRKGAVDVQTIPLVFRWKDNYCIFSYLSIVLPR